MTALPDELDDWRAADRQSRDRLRRIGARVRALGASDVTLPDGWNVSATLAHIGVWDSLTAARWRNAASMGRAVPEELAPGIVDFVNAGTLPLLATLSVEAALAIAERGADQLAEVLDGTAEEVLLGAYRLGRPNLVDRSRHRAEHLGVIEDALQASERATR